LMCCLWFLFLVYSCFFQQSYPFHLWKQGLSDVLLFVIPFFVFGLKIFFNSPTQFPTYKAGIEWCAALWIIFWRDSMSIFQQSCPFLPMKAGLSDAAPFVILSLCLVLRVFFNSPTQFLPYEKWCALSTLVHLFSTHLWKQDWVMAASDSFLTFGLRVFFNSLPNFYLWKQIEWCAVLWFLSCVCLRVFQQSYPFHL
jgi:hypothetical protein